MAACDANIVFAKGQSQAQMLRDIEEEISIFSALLSYPVLCWVPRLLNSIQFALTDAEVGVLHLTIKLRADKQNISKDSIDASV